MSPRQQQKQSHTNMNRSQDQQQYSGITLPPIQTIYSPQHLQSQSHSVQQSPLQLNSEPRYIPHPLSRTESSSSAKRSGYAISEILQSENFNPRTQSASSASSSAITSPLQESSRAFPSSRYDSQSPVMTRSELFDPLRDSTSRQSSVYDTSSKAPSSPDKLQSRPAWASRTTESFPERDRIRLIIRQQPQSARACGLGERDRRMIDPPPIVQLCLDNYNPKSESDRNILKSPFNVMHCQLISVSPDGIQPSGADVSRVHDPSDPTKDVRRLMGSLTLSPFITEDLTSIHGLPKSDIGSYYIFYDLSCRQNGRYKLRFTLTPVDLATLAIGGRSDTITTIDSDEFTVYSAKDFPGMLPSSDLTKRLKDLGSSVPLKKGKDNRTRNNKRASDSDESGDID